MRGKRSIFTLAAVVLLLVAAPAIAGLNRWTSSGFEGARITALVTDPADRRIVYAATEGGGIFRTIDAGDPPWEPVNTGLENTMVTALGIDASGFPTLYAGTASGRIFRSADRGQQWIEVGKPDTGRVRAFAFDAVRHTLFAACATSLLMSRDGGESWRSIPLEASSVAATRDGTVYVAARTEAGPYAVFVSIDGGDTWQPTATHDVAALAADRETSTIYATRHPNGVVFSADSGNTWQALPALDASPTSLLSVEEGLYAATSRGVYVYKKGTAGWTKAGTFDSRVEAVTVTSSFPRRIYAGTQNGVFTAAEASAGWQPANRGINTATVVDIAAGRDGVAHAATSEGLFETADGGASWQYVAGTDESLTHVVTNGDSVYVGSRKGIQSSDESWKVVTPRIPYALAASAATPVTLYAAFDDAQVARSTDGGRTWNPAVNGLDVSNWYLVPGEILETDRKDADSVYTAYCLGFWGHGGLFKTTDRGQTWSRLRGAPMDCFTAVGVSGTTIHGAFETWNAVARAYEQKGIVTSIDGGRSWSASRLAEERVQALVVDPVNPERSYAGTASGRVYRSDDSGNEWVLFSDGLHGAAVHRLAINDSGKRIYAATAGGVFVNEIGPPLPFERLPDDPARLPRLIRQVVAGVGSASRALSASNAFVLSAAGTVHGSGGTVFRTDVTLSNGRSTEQEVMVAWLPQGNDSGPAVPMFRITLPAGSEAGGGTLTITEITDELRLQGLGSMVIIAVDSGGDVDGAGEIDGFARVRSLSPCGSGWVSQSLPSVPLNGTGSARRGRALGLRHEPAYRTNVGIVNLGEVTREFTIIVSGDRASERLEVSVPPFSPLQSPVPDRNYGAVAVTVISDGAAAPWVAYGSSVDNRSGDAWAAVATPLRD
jgi:photosystem II stability/assembly factor-like uncharacterized protein